MAKQLYLVEFTDATDHPQAVPMMLENAIGADKRLREQLEVLGCSNVVISIGVEPRSPEYFTYPEVKKRGEVL